MNKTVKDKIVLKTLDPLASDHELQVWEKWIKIRKEETKNLAFLSRRSPVDLTMNQLVTVRKEKERKIALEHAQIDEKPHLRGGPWEQPLRLKQKCHCMPVYEVQRTQAEMGTPQVIEHVGVPQYIQESELGIPGKTKRKTYQQLDAEYVRYKEKREKELRSNIEKVDPLRPEIEELIVRGVKPKSVKKKMPPLPTFSFDEYINGPEISSVYAVRINNTVLYKDIPDQALIVLEDLKKERWHENCTSWMYYFNVPIKRAGRSKLYLENLGTVTLRYCWKKVKNNIPFIPEKTNDQVFFFNKNEDVISPGQNKELFFTFLTDKPGIFNESWELSFCNIYFFDTLAKKLTINLSGDSVEDFDRINKKVDVLKARIDKKVTNNIVTCLINDIVSKAITVEPQIYPYKNFLLESEMFVMKNPVCFYHQTLVMKMNDLYTEMAPDEDWDLGIGTWRQKMMEKEYDARMKYYELLKLFHNDLLKPWYEGENVLMQKYRAMKWLLGEMADKFDIEYERALDVSGIRHSSIDSGGNRRISGPQVDLDPIKLSMMRNLFYLYAYEHVAATIEMCAGILSSIDLNRWIKFDFC